MALRLHAHPWARTPLGPIERWPVALRSAVDLMLAMPQPAYIAWGADLLSLYNDAYIPVLGDKHPDALGKSYHEVWSELSQPYREALEATLAGQAQFFQDEPMALAGRNREISWFTFSWTPLRDETGAVAGFFTVGTETTEKVLAQQALQTAVEAADLGTWSLDLRTGTAECSLRHDRMLGYADLQPEWTVEIAERHFVDEDRHLLREGLQRALETGRFHIDARVRWPDGSVHWIAPRGRVEYDADGRAVRIAGIVADVTDQRWTEARYRSLFDSLDKGCAIAELIRDGHGAATDYRVIEINGAYERVSGLTADRVVGVPATQVIGDEALFWVEHFEEVIASGTAQRLQRYIKPLEGWFDLTVCHVDGDRVAVLFDNVTARVHAEQALRESQERQAFLLRLSDALRPLDDPLAIQGEAARVLGEELDAGRAYYVDVDERAGQYVVACDWHRPGETSHLGRAPLRDWPAPWLVDGRTWVVRDIAAEPTIPDTQREAYAANGTGALIVVPLVRGGRIVGACPVNQRDARAWTAAEIALVEETAERTWAALDRARTEAALRESEERYRAILESALDYAIFTTDADGRIQTWPPGAAAVFGWTAAEAIGQHAAITCTPEDRENGVPWKELHDAREKGVAPNVRWHLRKDGRRVFIEGSTRPLRDGALAPVGYLKVGQDVTERREWEERQQVLLAELQHRTRNLLGVVRSMFERTRRSTADIDELTAMFTDRMAALARVQGLLSRLHDGDRIAFDELIRVELSAMGAVDADGVGERVVLDGPSGVRLRSSTVQTFALALHELATNATKYGALGQAGGQLRVRWRLVRRAGAPRLRIEWTEAGVDMPAAGSAPRGTGYGRELIERALPYQLQAETSYALGPDGVRCTIEMPVSDTTRTGGVDDV